MREGIAAHDGRAHVGPALEDGFARSGAVPGGGVFGAGGLQALLDLVVDEVGHLEVGETGQPSVLVVGPRGLHGAQLLRERFGDLRGVAGHDDGRGVDAGPSAVVADGADHHVDVLAPVLDLVLADEDLAPTRPVQLDGRVVGVLSGGGLVTEDERPSAIAEDGRRSVVVGGVEAEGLRRHARGDERLDQPVRRPRLFSAGFDDDRRLERDGGDPERVHRGRIARHHEAERRSGGEEAELGAELLAVAPVEDREIEAARQAVEHLDEVREGVVQLGHVAPDHHVRQAGGPAERLDVLLRGLRVAAVAERQRAAQEELARLGRQLDELGDGELLQRGARRRDLGEVALHDAAVDGGDESLHLARAVVLDLDLLEGFVAAAEAEDREMRDAVGCGHGGDFVGGRK